MVTKDDLLTRRSNLSTTKRTLLEQRLQAALDGAAHTRSILRRSAHGPVPLSFAQQRLWFLDQFEPGSSFYNIANALQLRGPLNAPALERGLGEVVRRHEILRTTFTQENSRPLQAIAPPSAFRLPVIDLSALSESERSAEVRRLARAEARRSFDLSRGPLLRATLLRSEAEDHTLLLTMHHIVADGWSMGVLFRELTALYEAFSAGRPSPLPELPIQYADFALWQRQQLEGKHLQNLLAFWKRQLEGAPMSLELPTDRPRPAVQTFRGASRSHLLPKPLAEALKALSQGEGVTLFMTLLAAFNALLYRYTGQDDLLVATTIAGRDQPEVEPLIGFFVNILPLRTKLSGDPSFQALLAQVREVTTEAYVHQELPFGRLIEALKLRRDPSRAPLAQVAFTLHNAPHRGPQFPGLALNSREFDTGTSQLDLALSVVESEQGLVSIMDYNTDLFEAATVDRMLGHYQALLESIVADPGQRLADLTSFIRTTAPHSEVPTTPRDRSDALYERSNLTRNQLLIWAGQKLQPDVPLYNLVSTFTISGAIDPECFRKAFHRLVNATDALRTVVREVDGIPQQSVLPEIPCPLMYMDVSRLSDPRAELREWVHKYSQIPFDFERRLFESALIKVSDSEFVWYLKWHHIITDLWSAALILQRMSEYYGRALQGASDEGLNSPRFQDYVSYERRDRRSLRHQRAEAYWKRKLAEDFAPLTFYGRAPRQRTARVRTVHHELSLEQTQWLKTLARTRNLFVKTENVSLFNIFAGLLLAYLHRVSGHRRLAIGTPFHNRRSEAFKRTIGLFMEVLPLQIAVDVDDTFLSLIHKVAAEASETLEHRQYAVGNPLRKKAYDVYLNFHPASFPDFHGKPVTHEWVHVGYGNDSLVLHVHDFGSSGRFGLEFEFSEDFFNPEQADLAVRHFIGLLDAFLEDQAQPLNRVDLLSTIEKQYFLADPGSAAAALPSGEIITERFEAQVRETPDRLAVLSEGQSLTYAQLNAQANQLARYLRKLGVGPEARVGICMERSPEMIAGLLGILKAGGAYIPLDPECPPERRALILADAGASLLLTEERRLTASERSAVRALCLDRESHVIARESRENLERGAGPDNLAYIIYTSGSTGRPKGVMVQHRSLLNYSETAHTKYALSCDDRILQFASMSFDTSAEEIYPALITGAALVLRADWMLSSVSMFLRACHDHAITVLDLPTSYWHEIAEKLDAGTLAVPASVRLVIIGGERALPKRLARWQKQVGQRLRLINTYGPTEATIVATMCELLETAEPVLLWEEVPIGRALDNVQTYVLDGLMQPTPAGVPGQLYIGGVGLARGYLSRPDLTAEQFIPNPFSPAAGARLYKTGDLARYRTDGTMEFAGRIDHQVKIRGYRIELEEIEAVLRQHETVQEAVVIVREDMPDDKRLVAYIVTDKGQAPARPFRDFLADKLPDYMIPSAFVRLETLPRTPVGKINREGLPAPIAAAHSEPETAFVPPRTPLERAVAGVCAQVLAVDEIGIYDNFFEVGGHSLLAIMVASRLREIFEIEDLPLRSVFEAPTVARLAEVVAQTLLEQDREKAGELLQELEKLSEEEIKAFLEDDDLVM